MEPVRVHHCTIEGIVPLLFNRFSEDVGSATPPRKKSYDDREEALKRLYLTEDKQIYTPAEHLDRSMQNASVNFKYSGRKTFKDYFKAAVFARPDAIVHKNQEWVIDKRPVVIKGARIMRVRPKLEQWGLDFDIEVWDSSIEKKNVNEILAYAGRFVGIGDYRPKFGRFIVTRFE
jgi:hypothetical protein